MIEIDTSPKRKTKRSPRRKRKPTYSSWVIIGCSIIGLVAIGGAVVVRTGLKLPPGSSGQQEVESEELRIFKFGKALQMRRELTVYRSTGSAKEFGNWLEYYSDMPFEDLCKDYETFFPQRWHQVKKRMAEIAGAATR